MTVKLQGKSLNNYYASRLRSNSMILIIQELAIFGSHILLHGKQWKTLHLVCACIRTPTQTHEVAEKSVTQECFHIFWVKHFTSLLLVN